METRNRTAHDDYPAARGFEGIKACAGELAEAMQWLDANYSAGLVVDLEGMVKTARLGGWDVRAAQAVAEALDRGVPGETVCRTLLESMHFTCGYNGLSSELAIIRLAVKVLEGFDPDIARGLEEALPRSPEGQALMLTSLVVGTHASDKPAAEQAAVIRANSVEFVLDIVRDVAEERGEFYGYDLAKRLIKALEEAEVLS